MPVATVGDCRLSGSPRSPRACQLLQKIWHDRGSPKYVPPKGIVDPFLEDSSASALPPADDEVETISIGSGCRRQKDSPTSREYRPPLTRGGSFQTPFESSKNCNRYIEKSRLLSFHQSIDCPDSPDNTLPLDLIQSSVTADDTSETGISNPVTPAPPTLTFNDKPETSRKLHQNFCSCKRTVKPTWKSYEEAFQKSGGGGGVSILSSSESRESNHGTTCWCWSSKLVLYTIYLCIVFLLVFFTEAARMVMVPITVFLIVLSLALFLFILFCVCFIIFI